MKNRLPNWLKKNKDLYELREVKKKLRKASLSTVCEEARCPNITECFSKRRATFLILGNICTRACRFCSIKKGRPGPVDWKEPARVATAAAQLGLKHVVITSVTRDDLPDRGAHAFAKTIAEIRKRVPDATIEVLTPDFSGNEDLLKVVLDARPDVFNHNVEIIRRLHPDIRPGADLDRSLNLLKMARVISPNMIIKSGFMVGLGEDEKEIEGLLGSLSEVGLDIVTIGQYMRPSKKNIPVKQYWPPPWFEEWTGLAKTMGIRYVISGPFVRSSYHAKEALEAINKNERDTK